MKAQHIAAIIAISLLTIISIALVTQNPMTQPETTRTLTLTGIMGLMSFPATYQGQPGPIGSQDLYINSSAFVMTQSEGNSTKTYYLYCPTFHSEMLIGGGNGLAAGLTGDEIGGAYKAHLRVEVTGTPFKVTRWGNEYDLLSVSSIRILEPLKAPLIVYQTTGYLDLGLVNLPQTLPYGLMGKTQTYRVLLNEGEVVGFRFNSTKPMTVRLLTPDKPYVPGDLPTHESVRWSDVTSMSGDTVALIRGEYMLEFSSDKAILADVTLDIWRIAR